MYHDPRSVATHHPAINPRSYDLAVAPLEQRAANVTAARDAKVADMAHALELERQQRETFRPKINTVSEQLASSASVQQRRVPLAERTNALQVHEQEHQQAMSAPLPAAKPALDANSRRIVESATARANLDAQQNVRRKVRQLWTDHAAGNTMSAHALRSVLFSVELDGRDDVLWAKFLVALGVETAMHNGQITPVPMSAATGSKVLHHDEIAYDKFLKVFSALLMSAEVQKQQQQQEQQQQREQIKSLSHSPQPRNGAVSAAFAASAKKSTSSVHGNNNNVKNASANPPRGPAPASVVRAASAPQQQQRAASLSASLNSPPQPQSQQQVPIPTTASVRARQEALRQQQERQQQQLAAQEQQIAQQQGQRERLAKQVAARQKQLQQEALERRNEVGEHNAHQVLVMQQQQQQQREAQPQRGGKDWLEDSPPAAATTQHQPKRAASATPHAVTASSSQRSGSGMGGRSASNNGAQQQADNNNNQRQFTHFPVPAGIEQAIKRMAAAREMKKPKFEDSLRSESAASSSYSFGNNQNSVSPNSLRNNNNASEPCGKTRTVPFQLRSAQRAELKEQEKPLLNVDIDLPGGRRGRISVHYGDVAADLARSFSFSHSLGEDLSARLEHMLQQRISEFYQSDVGRKAVRKLQAMKRQREMMMISTTTTLVPGQHQSHQQHQEGSPSSSGSYAAQMMTTAAVSFSPRQQHRQSQQQSQQPIKKDMWFDDRHGSASDEEGDDQIGYVQPTHPQQRQQQQQQQQQPMKLPPPQQVPVFGSGAVRSFSL